MKNLVINLPELGNAVGTTKHTTQRLEKLNSTIFVGKTKQNEPALYYIHDSDKDKDGNYKKYLLMYLSNQTYNEMSYPNISGNVFSCLPTGNDYQVGLFNYLSKAAEKMVWEFLKTLAENFENKYNIS